MMRLTLMTCSSGSVFVRSNSPTTAVQELSLWLLFMTVVLIFHLSTESFGYIQIAKLGIKFAKQIASRNFISAYQLFYTLCKGNSFNLKNVVYYVAKARGAFCLCSYPAKQWAAVRTQELSTSTPPHIRAPTSRRFTSHGQLPGGAGDPPMIRERGCVTFCMTDRR